MKPIATLLLPLLLKYVSAQSCDFNFEINEELGDYELSCRGSVGLWTIVDTPADKPNEAGKRALTTEEGQYSCMISKREIQMTAKQEINVFFYLKTYPDKPNNYYYFSLSLKCQGNGNEQASFNWIVSVEETHPKGEWVRKTNTFDLSGFSLCQVQVELFQDAQNVLIDRIELVNPESPPEECYEVPRPPEILTSTTDEPSFPTTSTSNEATIGDSTQFPSTEYPRFSSFYWIVIIASMGALAGVSALLCCGILKVWGGESITWTSGGAKDPSPR